MAHPWKITFQVTVIREAFGDEAARNQARDVEMQLLTAVRAVVGGTEHTVTLQHVQIAERRAGGDRRKATDGPA